MHLNPYGQDAVALAVELVNDPPASPAGLAQRCRAAGLVVDMSVRQADLEAAADLIVRWTEIVDAGEVHIRAALVNRLLAEATGPPRLTDHVGTGWHLHYRADDLPLGGVLRALVATGTALHLAGRGMHRLGRCAAGGCDTVHADFSRTGRRRYCSTACGNRDAVRRHRSARVAAGTAGGAMVQGPFPS